MSRRNRISGQAGGAPSGKARGTQINLAEAIFRGAARCHEQAVQLKIEGFSAAVKPYPPQGVECGIVDPGMSPRGGNEACSWYGGLLGKPGAFSEIA